MRRMLALTAGLMLAPLPARADDYFITVFTAESVPFESKKTHTFAALQKVSDGAVTQHSISWLPESRKVRGLTLRPEAGANVSLDETFKLCRERGMRVSAWGPYRAKPELYDRLVCQKQKLESGTVRYKPTDSMYPSNVACNCYHALWQPVAPHRKYAGPFNCGDATGPVTVHLFSKWLIEPCHTHDELLELTVPKGESVTRRAFDDKPTRADAIRSARER
ncbi:hypothetical protein R5W23_003780 [Gemmata sp. JC673]|uniref:Uncharacterized protein n=1 Tax=Gemmata algarum TaxID=2975278 RepID=A0ABU5F448_9BACT|nr:hypothetical protein [Gemmata algarum]MDY3562315.1 hypothetical protein [Gemmata algarum]